MAVLNTILMAVSCHIREGRLLNDQESMPATHAIAEKMYKVKKAIRMQRWYEGAGPPLHLKYTFLLCIRNSRDCNQAYDEKGFSAHNTVDYCIYLQNRAPREVQWLQRLVRHDFQELKKPQTW